MEMESDKGLIFDYKRDRVEASRTIFGFTPAPPGWRVNWEAIDRAFPWIRAMRDCPQDPYHHAEGNVWIHTRMVCEAMAALPAWRALPEEGRAALFASALLHDVAKPLVTRLENGRLTSRGHAWRGAIFARRLLWELGVPFARRERIAALVRHHQTPYWLAEDPHPQRTAYHVSQTARCDELAILSEADVRGRICADQQRLLDNVAFFAEFCRSHECWDAPRRFANAQSRFEYFRTPHRSASHAAQDGTEFEVILMSGLPGAGKDTWIRRHAANLPVVALDEIRRSHGAAALPDSGAVVAEAREAARALLQRKEPFVWNAANLTRDQRRLPVDLFTAYNARIRIVYVEAPAAVVKARQGARPEPAYERLLDRWEVPEPGEAQEVVYVTE
jgi:predicted kinase